MIVVTVRHTDYGAILDCVEQMFIERPDPEMWFDRVEFLVRG